MKKRMKFLFLFFLFKFYNLKIIYIFSEDSIFNQNKNFTINNTNLNISESEEYIIKGNCEKARIIINANYITLYLIGTHLNSGIKSLITINKGKKNIIINLNEAILSSSFNSGIIEMKKDSNLIINSESSIFKGGIILKGKKESLIKIKGFFSSLNKIKYIDLLFYICENFILLSENDRNNIDYINIEITTESILKQKEFNNPNSYSFKKNIVEQSSQIYNKETNFMIKIQNIFEKEIENKENNTFYLDYLYFKHVNIAKEQCEEKILKKYNISFRPKVSVIIPIYNVQNYLITCIESIVNQTLKEIEIICVNDGSTDDSLFILKEYSKKDNRIMIINQRNRGLSEARNTGIKYSKGEFIYFLDSDDYLEKNALFELYNYAKKFNLDIIYFQTSSFRNNEVITNNEKNNNLTDSNFTIDINDIMEGKYLYVKLRLSEKYSPVVWLSFIRKQFYINTGLSFYPGILHEDVLFTLTGILNAKKAIYITRKYHHYRITNDSIMQSKKTVKNLYGWYISYCGILKILKENKFEEKVIDAIKITHNYLKRLIKRYIKIISNNEKKILSIKLTNSQKEILSSILNQ